MEPPKGFLATLWSFLRFLPYFVGLLILGIIKGKVSITCPFLLVILICLLQFSLWMLLLDCYIYMFA